MGHYDSDYTETERLSSEESEARQMKARRKLITQLDEFSESVYRINSHSLTIPDRFKEHLEDFHNWLSANLSEWERKQTFNKLKE